MLMGGVILTKIKIRQERNQSTNWESWTHKSSATGDRIFYVCIQCDDDKDFDEGRS